MTITGDYRQDWISWACRKQQHYDCGGSAPAGPCECTFPGHTQESSHHYEGGPPAPQYDDDARRESE